MSKKPRQCPPTQKMRNLKILERLASLASEMDDEESMLLSSDLFDMLENMSSDDAFGTEGQNDPRGDMRNGEWTMKRVEGLDK